MNELEKLYEFYKLKFIKRETEVEEHDKRKESSAEHSWSCLILADYFLTFMENIKIDRLRVYELLMYHDVVEIETGDTGLHKKDERKNKKKIELNGARDLSKKLPDSLREKFLDLFNEYEDQETIEARFAKAIDRLDPTIQCMMDDEITIRYKFTEKIIRNMQEKYYLEFPMIHRVFNDALKFYEENKRLYKK